MLQKSPSGSLCPYYYMGGELHPLKYGSYFDQKEPLLSVMKAEEEFILKSAGQKSRRIWIDLYETRLTDDVIQALVLHIKVISPKILNLCMVGCSKKDIRRIKYQMKKQNLDLADLIQYFDDPEIAKKWLIGKLS